MLIFFSKMPLEKKDKGKNDASFLLGFAKVLRRRDTQKE